MKNTGKWVYHFGGSERWDDGDPCDTRELAISEGRAYSRQYAEEELGYEGEEVDEYLRDADFQVGEICEFEPKLDGDWALDMISESAADNCGEFSEGYLDGIGKEQRDELTKRLTETFNAWAKETKNEPAFYMIENAETVLVAVQEGER